MRLTLIQNIWIFLTENWGDSASVFGAALTIFFSIKAAKSAKGAKEAAESTRTKLQKVDILSELGRINSLTDDVLRRLEVPAWTMVSERATEIRVSLSALLSNQQIPLDEETVGNLTTAISQFKNIAVAADKVILNKESSPDIARYRRILADQKEVIAIALQSMKVQMGEDE